VQKTRIFTELNKDRQTHRFCHKALKWEHFMQCFKVAWDIGFTVERNLKGWRLEEMILFNRNALCRKHLANNKPLFVLSVSIGHIAIAEVIPPLIPASESLSPAATTKGPSPAAAPSLPHMPMSFAEVIHFVKRKDTIPAVSGPLSY